jgi:hypothetical protein
MDHKRHDSLMLELACMGLMWLIMAGGCSSTPRMRLGAFFGSPGGMTYYDPNDLGHHSYHFSFAEKDGGLVYTSHGGFIDIGHVREAADRAAYASHIAYQNVLAGRTEFTCQIIEPSIYYVSISYPPGWKAMTPNRREQLAREVSVPLGQYIAHKSLIWHEIITGYGFSSTGVFSEKISSFSFEDTYSDATGILLGGQAVRDPRPYDDAMTDLLNRRLAVLDAQPPDVARQAVKQIDGRWYTGDWYFWVEMKQPSFDVGKDGGRIMPRLVPGVCKGATPMPCPVPNLEGVSRLGFRVTLEIDPRIWEQKQIFRTVHMENNTDMIQPEVHFPEIIDKMAHQTR